jgi:hypothetical protein
VIDLGCFVSALDTFVAVSLEDALTQFEPSAGVVESLF